MRNFSSSVHSEELEVLVDREGLAGIVDMPTAQTWDAFLGTSVLILFTSLSADGKKEAGVGLLMPEVASEKISWLRVEWLRLGGVAIRSARRVRRFDMLASLRDNASDEMSG